MEFDPATSFYFFKEEIKQWIKKNFNKNSAILDVGAGSGTYKNLLGDDYKNMDAVEIYYPNIINYGLFEKYRNVFKCDIVDFKYSDYDLIIFGDVIEHLAIEDAKTVLNYAAKKCKNFIVAVPYNNSQEENVNKWEEHIQDDLTPENVLERYPMLKELYRNDEYGYYIKSEDF